MIIRSPEEIERFLDKHKLDFYHPECYLGREPNTFHKDWNKSKFKILIAGLWRYEDNRGNQTLSLLYQMINEKYPDVICERAFFPNTEQEYKLFRQHNIPIFGLESKHSLGEYDLVMTSLSYVPPWLNFPLMLEMSGVPVRWRDRLDDVDRPIFMIGGSAMYGNFSLAYPVVDIVYLGDAEAGLFPLLDAMMQDESLYSIQRQFDYVFVTHYYLPEYEGEKFKRWVTVPQAHSQLRVIRCDNLDDAPALTRPIPSYTDSSMGLGEIELSRGCRGVCAFCGIGWKYRPYRERSPDRYMELITENREKSGTYKGLCPISTEFAYYTHKRGLFNRLRRLSATVDPLSMRIDAFADDPEFATTLAETGMNNLAVGVEGVSQKLRNRYMKGITREDILKACRVAIESGAFNKIKFFMISNLGEVWEDYEEFFALLSEINLMKHQIGSKIQIKVSWTPLFVEPCTPLQWMKPTIEERQPWKQIGKCLDELKVEYPRGGGGKNEENFLWVMQGMHLGDTRFADAIVDAALLLKRPFYVSHSKQMKKVLSKCLGIHGYEWSYLMRERAPDELFPWDIVDRGVSKKSLLNTYTGIKSGVFDAKVTQIKPKVEQCVIDKVENYEKHSQRWYIAAFEIGDEYDVVPNTHLIAQIHRAAYIENVPIAVNSLHFNSDRANRNWFYGRDFVFIGSTRLLTPVDLEKINRHVIGIKFENIRDLGNKKPRFMPYVGEYLVELGMKRSQLVSYCLEIEAKKKVEILAPETRYFSGERKKIFDLKEEGIYYDLEIEESGDDLAQLRVKLNEKVGIRYFLKGLFPDMSFKRILGYSIWKLNLYHHLNVAVGDVCEEVL